MRLICPNCGAQYEVPDEVIPEDGRDVQCSNCGDTWFQPHPTHQMTAGDETGSETERSDEHAADWSDLSEEESEAKAGPAETEEPARRDLDPEVASVLREEAAREEQARAAEARGGGLETQPDLGLGQPEDEADRRSRQARARMARLRGTDTPDEAPEEEDLIPSRRGLLPDIEETDTSIVSGSARKTGNGSARDGSEATPAPDRTGGFRRGMRLAIGLALLATALYIFAPQLAEAVPALAEPLATYVQKIDAVRIALHGAVGGIVAQVGALFAG